MPPAASERRSQPTAPSGARTAWRFKFTMTSPAFGRRLDETGKTAAAISRAESGRFPSFGRSRSRRRRRATRSRDAYARGHSLDSARRRAASSRRSIALGAREAAAGAAAEHLAVIERHPNREFGEYLSRQRSDSPRNGIDCARPRAGTHCMPGRFRCWLLGGSLVRLLFIGDKASRPTSTTYAAWALGLSAARLRELLHDGRLCRLSARLFLHSRARRPLWQVAFAAHDPVRRAASCWSNFRRSWPISASAFCSTRSLGVSPSAALALGAAALYLLNPAIDLYLRALWGQVDSDLRRPRAAGRLLALAQSRTTKPRLAPDARGSCGAWLSFAYSLLIKPQAAVLLPLFVAFAFVGSRDAAASALVATAIGIAGCAARSRCCSPSRSIPAIRWRRSAWLIERYAFGSSVYPYNTRQRVQSLGAARHALGIRQRS